MENDKSLPSATTLSNLFKFTDININWLLTGKGPVQKTHIQGMENNTGTSQLYKDFLFMMEDTNLKILVEDLIKVYKDGGKNEQAKISGFLASLR